MTLEIRAPREDERDEVARAVGASFNKPADRVAPRMPLEQMRSAFNGATVIATAGGFDLLQWFGGKPVPTSGVFLVTTLPEHRGRGVMHDVMRAVMDDARERGMPLTSL